MVPPKNALLNPAEYAEALRNTTTVISSNEHWEQTRLLKLCFKKKSYGIYLLKVRIRWCQAE